MTTETKLLDHGYIKLIEHWGSDQAIVESARMSTGKGFLGWGPKHRKDCPNESNVYDCNCNEPGDEKLLKYLYKNRHDTPFEMAGMTVEVRAPIIVFREWHRHRVPWSYNEASARYAPLPALDYVPTVERCMRGGGHLTKQAGNADGATELTADFAQAWTDRLAVLQKALEEHYQLGLRGGIPKELARGSMTVFRHSTMRASANVRGWFHLFGLRRKGNAQEEFRVYADAAFEIASRLFPRACSLFAEGFQP